MHKYDPGCPGCTKWRWEFSQKSSQREACEAPCRCSVALVVRPHARPSGRVVVIRRGVEVIVVVVVVMVVIVVVMVVVVVLIIVMCGGVVVGDDVR